MKYKYVQLVAYHAPTLKLIDTLPESSKPTLQVVKNLTAHGDKISGKAAEQAADAQNRVQRLLDVFNWAVESIPYDKLGYKQEPDPLRTNQTETLKVFIVPEFYFRSTADGYSWNTLTNILECLKQSFGDWRFDDWLIVPGTICSHQDAEKSDKGAFFNTASVIRGGRTGSMTFVHKKVRSNIDGVPDELIDGARDPKFLPILGSWKEQKERLFEFDGITFGLDVCLDHSLKALKNTAINWPDNENGVSAPAIDVHLITSCGMSIKTESVAARAGGCVMLCDGHPRVIEYGIRSGVKPVSVAGTKVTPATLGAASAEEWKKNVPDACAIPKPSGVDDKDWVTQEVVVYKPIQLFT
ncbi:MAG TPA: hypothetical protein VI260_13775 [Blastocatellia bacterium]|jgi:hypothetical protein